MRTPPIQAELWSFFWLPLLFALSGSTFAQAEDALLEQGLHGFALEAGEVLLPRLEPGVSLHRAQVEIPEEGRYRFHVQAGGGVASLQITRPGGETLSTSAVSPWMDLEWTELSLELRFEPAGAERQRLRILWEREMSPQGGFLPEPLPHGAWRPVNGLQRLDGMPDRLLLEQKGCSNCHLPSEKSREAVGRRRGPDLSQVGSRLDKNWMRRWIQDPSALHPGADMPRLLQVDEGDELDALVEFLASSVAADFAATDAGSVASEAAVHDPGRQLYHAIGCVACHGALESERAVFQDLTRSNKHSASSVLAPFGDLQGKWLPAALSQFLQQPSLVYPDGRMPSLGLTAAEADALTNYLLTRWGAGSYDPTPPNPEAAQRGKLLFKEQGCVACHELPGIEAPVAPGLDQLAFQGGCLDAALSSGPRYDLAGEQRLALARGIRSAAEASGAPAPLDRARRALANLNCMACHSMNGQGGPAEALQPYFQVGDERVDLGDEGRLPPDLSGIGWKLTTSWLRAVLLDQERARPYLMVRMPEYAAAQVGELPESLARMEGLWPGSDVESPEVSDAEVQIGREMMGREALSCVTCHSFRDLDPLGSPGTSIDQFGERLRYEWARSFLRAPQRFKPGSRMPDFYAAGKSTLHTVYDGDLGRQVDAMWAYFGLGEFMPPPPGMQAGQGLQILVGERPRVMRAFLEGSGSRAIAVGNPEGAHYAFDAERVALSEVWKGDFVDASGSWAGRGGSTLGGMGAGLWASGEGVPLQLFGRSAGRGNRMPPPGGIGGGLRFRGYRLDAEGRPTFLYDIRGSRVEERVQVELVPRPRIKRFFRIAGAGITGITLNAMSSMHPVPRLRFDGSDWATPEALPEVEGRRYFHQVIPQSTTTIEIELELWP